MPELPEVETTRRGINPHIKNQTVDAVIVRERRLRWPIPNDFTETITGHTVIRVSRRAKYLLFELKQGAFMIHLGMSGSLRIVDPALPPQKHDHVDFIFSNGHCLRFNDPRRFGSILWLDNNKRDHALLNALGPEPFASEFNGGYLFAQSRKRKCAVKTFIMDNHVVVGVGNIYANEALFNSGIRPRKAAGRITRAQYQTLSKAILKVLNASIKMGGTTLKDFVGGDGQPGYFQQTLNVYGRENDACRQCESPIKLIRLGQRSTFYCPSCQS